MAQRITTTRGADAPLASAKRPNPAGAGLEDSNEDDELVGRTVTIQRPRQALYEFWRDFRNLPLFMETLERIAIIDGTRSHWVVRGPADSTVEWDSLITEDIPGELIAWSSADG